MLRVSKSVLVAGGVVVGAGLMLLANPKTVHAVAAALVQVTNTSSNPVVTQGISQQAGEIVEILCETSTCNQVLPDGTTPTQFVVPAGHSLVITSVDIQSVGATVECNGTALVTLLTNTTQSTREEWFVSANSGTQHFTYPSGFVIGPGITVTYGYLSSGTSCDGLLKLVGYLTTN